MDERDRRLTPGYRFTIFHRSGPEGDRYIVPLPPPDVGAIRHLTLNGEPIRDRHGVVVEVDEGARPEWWRATVEVREGAPR